MHTDRLVDCAAHEFVGLLGRDPADFGQFFRITDKDISPVCWPGGHVDHGAAGLRVDPAAEDAACADPESCLFLDFADGRVGRAFAGLDLAWLLSTGREPVLWWLDAF